MIKFILFVVIVLALIGGAIQFKATDESWSLVVNKEAALKVCKTAQLKYMTLVKNWSATPIKSKALI